MGREVEFDFNSFFDVDMRSSQSALGSDVYREFQTQDIVLENFSWLCQRNIASAVFEGHQDNSHPDSLLNDPFISMRSATRDIFGAEIHAINPMGRRFNRNPAPVL
ncbi:hypothetical protein BDV32DRAFT_149127 [Aspergillus pseudonomiae]|uniref:Uncharacterized protein n=1 Tax=Aspergillus pseudonomiae TaxID=1506151 RepID=A0A5N6I6G0_9EURO|nr:uncharacterized protein BDV37DRAFT_280932 [Aspergillus pseudonomiae]KAB8260693.1 hypothetical protein BDV32DRAFT_149127 [Aspergillus pseudonomiae]KAE8406335.1 hypothetical protein BDV37DRAFT_280932 [Aspergillus pseudonomiae]